MSIFRNRFIKILDEEIDDNLSPEETVSREGDAGAWNDSFEDEGDADAFNADPAMAGYEDRYIERVKAWKQKITDFTNWLNDPEGSLNKELDDLDSPNTPFEGISKESSKRITKIAEELAGLTQILNGIVFTSNQRKKEAGQELQNQEAEMGSAPVGNEF